MRSDFNQAEINGLQSRSDFEVWASAGYFSTGTASDEIAFHSGAVSGMVFRALDSVPQLFAATFQ